MTKQEWLKKANKLLANFKATTGKRTTPNEAGIMQQLQHGFGSHHGRHETSYKEAINSLSEMIALVEGGSKDSIFTK